MVNKKFVQDGDRVYIFDFDDNLSRDKLIPAIYTVSYDMIKGFFLEKNKDKFAISEESYGSLKSRTERIINTYEKRSSGTGVLLTGLKGSGKTLLSQRVSNKMLEKGIPVILVEASHSGDAFITFINSIGECVLIFDEFTKVFSADMQNQKNGQDDLLGIFDGNKSLKRLIFVIDNEARNLNEFYTNRPGRLFYHFQYTKLEEVVIDEYCEDYKIPELVKNQIKSAYYRIRYFSFDILKAIVDEYLRYPKEDIMGIIEVLNIDTDSFYKTCLVINKITSTQTNKEYELHGQISLQEIQYEGHLHADLYIKEKGVVIPKDEYNSDLSTYIRLNDDNIAFENKEKVICTSNEFIFEFEKKLKSTYDLMAF